MTIGLAIGLTLILISDLGMSIHYYKAMKQIDELQKEMYEMKSNLDAYHSLLVDDIK